MKKNQITLETCKVEDGNFVCSNIRVMTSKLLNNYKYVFMSLTELAQHGNGELLTTT